MKKKRKLTDRDIDFMLFEIRAHELLDALGCPQDPKGRINMRLFAWCKERGIDPNAKSCFKGKRETPPTPTLDIYG